MTQDIKQRVAKKEWADFYKEAAELFKINGHNLCKAYANIKEQAEELQEREEKLVALLKRTDSACIYASLFMAGKDNTTEAIFWHKKAMKIEAQLKSLGINPTNGDVT